MPAAKCSCEDVARGPCGLIEQNETLGRLLYFPDHIRADMTPKPGAFPISHIAEKGLSLIRTGKILSSELASFAHALASGLGKREWHGHAEFGVDLVRSLNEEDGSRLVCLFEDPTEQGNQIPANPAHAIMVSAISSMSEADAKEIRADIIRNCVVKLSS